MWFETRFIIRLFYTLKDIGFKRIFLRVRHEILSLLDKNLPLKLTWFFLRKGKNTPKFTNIKINIDLKIFNKKDLQENDYNIEFIFLNRKIKLKDLIYWNNKNWSRLFLFNIHYFEWARYWLDDALETKSWSKEASTLPFLIDSWIKSNTPKHGDGWHSYTTSLRVRNWIWIFLFSPDLITKKRIDSIWYQICWLRFRTESHHGGNHLLENLISLCFGGIVFDSKFSTRIYKYAIKSLEKELKLQILNDGGHEERSASYHILILDRLTELGCLLIINERIVPKWLNQKVKEMLGWLKNIRLINDNYPIFNDCPKETCGNINDVYFFAKGFVEKKCYKVNGLRGKLLNVISQEKNPQTLIRNYENYGITYLKDTGWTFLRFTSGWELVFKCGIPCPKHLGAHAHSDQLSFDLFYKGIPIIIETGTSSYDKSFFRDFERSSKAHNTIQLGIQRNYQTIWYEPIDVWSIFRAGKKASPNERDCGECNEWLWVQGSHNGYEEIGASHFRRISAKVENDNSPIIIILDRLVVKKHNFSLKSWLHFHNNFFKEINNFSGLNYQIWASQGFLNKKSNYIESYLSNGLDKREMRKVFQFSGDINKGEHTLITIIGRDVEKNKCKFINAYKGFIDTESNIISWDHKLKNYKIETKD